MPSRSEGCFESFAALGASGEPAATADGEVVSAGELGSARSSAAPQIARSTLFLGWLSLSGIAVFNAALLVALYRRNHFVGDDFITMALLRDHPIAELMFLPLNEHMVPLHRLVCHITHSLAPMSFGAALLVMYAFQVLALAYVYATLRWYETELGRHESAWPAASQPLLLTSKASWILLLAFGTNVYLSALYAWWSAGLHRIPYVAFSMMAIYHYLAYRSGSRLRDGVACIGGQLLALGFYSKGVLVPVYLAGLELCLIWNAAGSRLRARAALMGASALVSAAYLLVWRSIQPPHFRTFNTNVLFQLDYLQASWLVLRDSTLGAVHAKKSDRLALSLVIWVLAVMHTVLRRRRESLVWLTLLALLAVNVLLTSASKHRTEAYGTLLALFGYRYYYELVFVAVVFAGLALVRVRASGGGRDAGSDWLYTLGIAAISSVAMLISYDNSLEIVANANGRGKDFIQRVRFEADRLIEQHGPPLRIVEGKTVQGVPRLGYFLYSMGYPVLAVEPGPGAYRVDSSGHFQSAPN